MRRRQKLKRALFGSSSHVFDSSAQICVRCLCTAARWHGTLAIDCESVNRVDTFCQAWSPGCLVPELGCARNTRCVAHLAGLLVQRLAIATPHRDRSCSHRSSGCCSVCCDGCRCRFGCGRCDWCCCHRCGASGFGRCGRGCSGLGKFRASSVCHVGDCASNFGVVKVAAALRCHSALAG